MGHGDRDEELIRSSHAWELPAEPSPYRQEHDGMVNEGFVVRSTPGAFGDAALLGHGEPPMGTRPGASHEVQVSTAQGGGPTRVPGMSSRDQGSLPDGSYEVQGVGRLLGKLPKRVSGSAQGALLSGGDEVPGVGHLLGPLKKKHAPLPREKIGEEVEQEAPSGMTGMMDAGATDAQKVSPFDGSAVLPDIGVQASRDGAAAKIEPTTVSHVQGKDIEHYLLAGFLRPYVEKRLKKTVHIEGHIHEHEPEEFRRLYVDYLLHRIDDETGRRYTRAKAEAKERRTHAFRDGTEIYVHMYRGDRATTIHESIHLLSSDEFSDAVSPPVREGATEFFARIVCEEQNIRRTQPPYKEQLKAIKTLVSLVSKETLAEAYFHGHTKALRQTVDHAKGKGTFTRWLELMREKDYGAADKIL